MGTSFSVDSSPAMVSINSIVSSPIKNEQRSCSLYSTEVENQVSRAENSSDLDNWEQVRNMCSSNQRIGTAMPFP